MFQEDILQLYNYKKFVVVTLLVAGFLVGFATARIFGPSTASVDAAKKAN